jgi:hypothetical protein
VSGEINACEIKNDHGGKIRHGIQNIVNEDLQPRLVVKRFDPFQLYGLHLIREPMGFKKS